MQNKRDLIFVSFLLFICVLITQVRIPLGLQEKEDDLRVAVRILQVDDSQLEKHGLVQTGIQALKVRILEGEFEDQIVEAENQLAGRLEFDKVFQPNDKALAVITLDPNDASTIRLINVVDHYRINVEWILVALFTAFLIGFAGWVGVKSILSFVFTGLVIWKFLLPGFLFGIQPIVLSIAVVCVVTSVIIFLVAGFTPKGVVAFFGAMSGVILTCFLALLFGHYFRVHGAIKPFAETLLYSGYPNLDLTSIFLAGIFLSSSGAVMDIAMDIAATQHEIAEQNPNISRNKLIHSGFTVGKAVVGTMTTTLLLAYSGGFSTLLMVFIAQGTPAMNILNMNYIAGELLHTLVGSFGLVLVAPFTAMIGGWYYTRRKLDKNKEYKDKVKST